MACQVDINSLPVLVGCPADVESFIVNNAAGGLDGKGNYTQGVAIRNWSTLKNCIFSIYYGNIDS